MGGTTGGRAGRHPFGSLVGSHGAESQAGTDRRARVPGSSKVLAAERASCSEKESIGVGRGTVNNLGMH